jgi:4a-hydroxytetrahydrobiopterin dehydratase
MSTTAHAPLVTSNPIEAAEIMISEGGHLDPPATFDVLRFVNDCPRWSVQPEGLVAEFSFPTYLSGIEFVRQVAAIAESMNHHPDIQIGWRKVRLSIMTHSKKSITSLDGEFVKKVEALRGGE